MSPLEAAEAEIRAEFAALARRIGSQSMPDAVTVRVEFDRETQMPRVVECQEERGRRVLGSSVGRSKRCSTAA